MHSSFSKNPLHLSALALMATFWMSACDATLPEDEVRLCVKGGVTQEIVTRLADIARRHRLSFEENGPANKAELIAISADNSIIPAGFATNFIVWDGGTVVLMGGNIGSTGDLLLISFFNMKDDARRLRFKSDILAETRRMPDATLVYRGPGPDTEISCRSAPVGGPGATLGGSPEKAGFE